MVQVNAAQIRSFAREVDNKRNGGNGNGIVDGSEIELFTKKCKTAGLDNVDEIMENYNENKTQKEAKFEADKTTANSSVEAAVISALTEKTALRTNAQASNSAKTIKEGTQKSDENTKWYDPTTWFNDNGDFDLFDPSTWFNNQDEVLGSTKFINSKNAVEVLSDKNFVEKIESSDSEVKGQAVNQSVKALVKAAQDAQVDVSDIVFEENVEYKTGRALTDVEYGSPVAANFTKVAQALTKKISDAKKALNGQGSKEEMLTIASRKIDAEGNGNGYIDTEDEIVAFKQFAAEHNIDVDSILEEIRDNEENGVENTSKSQKTIYNIFDPEQKAARDAAYAADDADVSKQMADGIGEGDNIIESKILSAASSVATFFSNIFEGDDVKLNSGNEDLLNNAIGKVNSDNVMTVLNKNPELVDKIMNRYSHNWAMNIFVDDKFQNYTTPILTALVQRAQESGIDVSDIVITDENGNMMTGANSGVRAGKDATGEDYVQSVIKALQNRINEQEKA